jgi:hypothetical protein
MLLHDVLGRSQVLARRRRRPLWLMLIGGDSVFRFRMAAADSITMTKGGG